jgi:hypothetical protein
MGANVFSRPQTQHDPIRFFSQATGSQFDLVRRWQTAKTAPEFPDTEEVTGSNPVRPTSSAREIEYLEQALGAIPGAK